MAEDGILFQFKGQDWDIESEGTDKVEGLWAAYPVFLQVLPVF